MHILRQYSYESGNSIYSCTVEKCNYTSSVIKLFVKHIKSHILTSPTGITCPFASCAGNSTIYSNVNSYTVHFFWKHSIKENNEKGRVDSFNEKDVRGTETVFNSLSESSNIDVHLDNLQLPTTSCDEQFLAGSLVVNNKKLPPITKSVFDMYLTLSTKHHATEPIIQEVVSKSNETFKMCREKFSDSLQKSSFKEDAKSTVMQNFDDSFCELTNAIDRKKGFLRNSYNRKIYYQQNLNLILPVEEILLDNDGEDSGCRYSYVPILDTIAMLLMDEKIRSYFENVELKDNGRVMFDIVDGRVIKDNEFLKNHRNVVKIMFFQDAFEICNPLGASKKKFKIVAVYMVLVNLPPHLRTKTENIQLVLLCLDTYVTQFGWDKVLEKLIKDVKELETQEISLIIDGDWKNC